jgi:hypothetical protein
MTLKAISGEDVRFALIDLHGRNGGLVNGDRFSITTFRVRHLDGKAVVENEQTGANVGSLMPESLDWKLDRPKDIWSVPAFSSPDMNYSKVLVPLAGAMLMRHGTFREMARYAEQAMAGAIPEIEAIRALDKRVDALQAETDEIEAEAVKRATAGFDLDELDRRHASIVALMKDHDWTWDYADRPSRESREHEHKILTAVASIPEPEAIALWLRYSYAPMSMFSWERAKEHGRNLLGRRAA